MASGEKSCGVVLFKREGGVRRYLLVRHVKGGHWTPPKGHIEPGESELDTARREVREESGCADWTLIDGFRRTLRYPVSRNGRPVSKEAVYFLGEANGDDGRINPSEHTEMTWFTLPEAVERCQAFERQQKLLRDADAFLDTLPGDGKDLTR